MIRIQLVCDACGRLSDHHTSLGLNLRDDTEAAEAALDGLVAAVAHCGGNLAAD